MVVKTCIFPVAGLGTRLFPLTEATPKEILPVFNRPLLDYAFEEALESGIEKFIFIITSRKYSLIQYLEEKSLSLKKNQSIACLYQPNPLGLGHAILRAASWVYEPFFSVFLPDDLIIGPSFCLKQMVQAHTPTDGNMVAITTVKEDEAQNYGILVTKTNEKGNKIKAEGIIEKPVHSPPSLNAVVGRYILDKNIFSFLERQKTDLKSEIQLTDSIDAMTRKGSTPLTGFSYEGRRFDCGTKVGLLEAENFIRKNNFL